MAHPRVRPFEVVLAVSVTCVFAAHVLRMWGSDSRIYAIPLAAVCDTLFFLLLRQACRVGLAKPKPRPARREDGLDEWLA